MKIILNIIINGLVTAIYFSICSFIINKYKKTGVIIVGFVSGIAITALIMYTLQFKA